MKVTEEAGYGRAIDTLLVYVSCSAFHTARQWGPALLPFVSLSEQVVAERERRGLDPLPSPEELPPLWSATMMFVSAQKNWTNVQLGHARVLPTSEVLAKRRWGTLKGAGPFCEGAEVSIHIATGRTILRRHYFARANQGRSYWRDLTDKPVGSEIVKVRYTAVGSTMVGERAYGVRGYDPSLLSIAAWAKEHLWSVEFSMGPESAIALFVTDALGIKGFFQLRDKPEGRTRREALMHWVRGHARRLRADPETETQVREHVRGRSEFDWFGLHGLVRAPQVTPSPLPPRRR